MSTPGTHDEDGNHVDWSLAIAAWSDAARPVLVEAARNYGAMVKYGELADRIQETTGIRTRSLLPNWIGDVLAAVDVQQPEGEPALTSFVITEGGLTGPGYAGVLHRRGASPSDSLEDHAARERLKCHRYFEAPDLPADGGRPTLAPRIARERGEAHRQARQAPKTCGEHFIQLAADGSCSLCG